MSTKPIIHVNGETKPVDAGFDGYTVNVPACEHDLLSVELAGIRRKNDDNYEVVLFGTKFIEKELPVFKAGVREDRPMHIINAMKLCRDKINECFDKEISYQEEIQAKGGTRNAEVAEDPRPAKVTHHSELPSAIISSNVEEELKIAQSVPISPGHADRYGVK